MSSASFRLSQQHVALLGLFKGSCTAVKQRGQLTDLLVVALNDLTSTRLHEWIRVGLALLREEDCSSCLL